MTDPIADMLTRIRNGAAAHLATVSLPYSSVKFTIAKILEKEGYLDGVEAKPEERILALTLKYAGRTSAIGGLRRVSRPGRRVYVKKEDLPRVLSGHGVAIVSTSQGMMTNVEARARKLGGEIICEVH